MTVASGARLGAYELLSPIGAGGMGEVWKARDPRLSREVAIKLLPESFSHDADRLRRFEQEARAAGALNHPNLTAVYDVGRADGTSYLVEELLEGETLRAALAGGRFAPRKAIGIAVQIAQGLAAAHARGIVHRDLKPENVFVTRDGRVKILDFGLAKLARETESSAGSALPTESHGTDPGTVLGTLGYMSPEQVRGHAADARSDIFALGAILYEMLAGERAFKGDSAADTMSAILREDPPDLSVTNRSIAPGLERIVRHCLEKSPEQRFQSARDVAFDLEALSDVSAVAAPTRGAAASRRRLSVPLAVVAGLAVGALAGRAFLSPRVAAPSFTRLTYRRGLVQNARFAPDGRTIVYGASWDGAPFEVFTTSPGARESRRLSIGSADILGISSGGELALSMGRRFTIGFESVGTLARAPLEAEAPREVLENVVEADFTPDGKELLVVRFVGALCRMELPLGTVLYETPGWVSNVRISPRGDLVAFIDHPLRGDSVGALGVIDRKRKKRVLLADAGQSLAWSPDGDEVWTVKDGALRATRLSGGTRVLANVPGRAWLLDVSRDGRALLAEADMRREMVGLASGESVERNLTWLDWSFPKSLSDDGREVLFNEENLETEGGYVVYLRKLDGSPAVRLGEGSSIALSPDGRWALAVLRPFDEAQIALLPTGPGELRRLPSDGVHYVAFGRFCPDGKRFVVFGSEKGRPTRIWVRGLDGGRGRPVTPEGIDVRATTLAVSPDGLWVPSAEKNGPFRLYPIDGGAPREIPGLEAGDVPAAWSSPTTLLVMTPVGLRTRIHRLDLTTGARTIVKELTPMDPAGVVAIGPVLVVPDGSSYVYSYRRLLSTLYLVEGLK